VPLDGAVRATMRAARMVFALSLDPGVRGAAGRG
jgi:hypothetical protein